MKRTLLSSLILLGCMVTAFAQSIPIVSKAAKIVPKVDLGIKIGGNFEQLNGQSWEDAYQPGVVGGIFLGVRKRKIGVQTEFLINTAKYNTKSLIDSARKGTFRATYFNIPLLFEYRLIGGKLAPKVWLMAGPQFSGLMSVKSLNDYAGDGKALFKSGYFSGVVGLEVRFLKFCVGGRYITGLTNLNNETLAGAKETWTNKTIQLSLGFKFI